MYSYFIEKNIEINDIYKFSKDDAHHIKNVLRLKSGEIVRLVFNSNAYFAKIGYSNKEPNAFVYDIDKTKNELDINITLIQALIKNDKFELVLQKVCELGVSNIIPMNSKYVNVNSDIIRNKKDRYNKILLEAAKQSKREVVPILADIIKLEECLGYKSDINIFAYESEFEKTNNISKYIEKGKNITIIIGCEGGLSSEEATFLKNNNFIPVSLGKRILRAETASIYALSVISSVNEVNQ